MAGGAVSPIRHPLHVCKLILLIGIVASRGKRDCCGWPRQIHLTVAERNGLELYA